MTQSTESKYHMRYWVKPEPQGVDKSAAGNNEGLCDDIIIHSILRPDDGGLSHMVVSCDGRKGEAMESNDMFQIWALWAHSLMEDETLSHNRRQVAAFVHETVKAAVLAAREAEEEGGDDNG